MTSPSPFDMVNGFGVVPYNHPEPDSGATVKCRMVEEGEELPTFCGVIEGYWGFSSVFKDKAGGIIADKLSATAVLMFWVMVVMVPSALVLGVLAGMREGSRLDSHYRLLRFRRQQRRNMSPVWCSSSFSPPLW